MVEFYLKLVRSGKLSIDSVPLKYREKVRELLANEE